MGQRRLTVAAIRPFNEGLWPRVLRHDPCSYCGRRRNWQMMTVEHITPQSVADRPFGWKNEAGACATCNNARGNIKLLFYLWIRAGGARQELQSPFAGPYVPMDRRRDRQELPPVPSLRWSMAELCDGRIL